MPEDIRIIDEVNVSNPDIKCPGCGGTIGVKYDPETSTLTCPFCGLSTRLSPPEAGEVAQELDFNSAVQRANVNWGRIKKLIVCTNCGGQALYDAEQVTGACPFCGSTSVTPAAESEQIMAPGSIIPFTITKEMTQQCFINFLNRKKFVSKKVYDCKLENITGVYLPFWTFDAYTISSYLAKLYYYSVGGESYHRYFKGVWGHTFDDIVIFASEKIRNPYIAKIQKFDFTKAIPYSPEYLAGYPAERYTLGLNDAWEKAKKTMPKILEREIGRYEKKIHGGSVPSVDLSTNYFNVKFRYLLAPVYLATYSCDKYRLKVAINGQTGETYCDVPTYIGKLIVLFVLGMIALAVIEMIVIFLYSRL